MFFVNLKFMIWWEILTNSKELVYSVSSCYQYILGENLSFLEYSDEWEGTKQNSLTLCCKHSPEFSWMVELLFPLTDDVSWEFSPFFWSRLKINTTMNCFVVFFFSLPHFLWSPFVRRVWEASLFHWRWKERSSVCVCCWHTFIEKIFIFLMRIIMPKIFSGPFTVLNVVFRGNWSSFWRTFWM